MVRKISLLSSLIMMLILIIPLTTHAEQRDDAVKEIMQQMTPKEKIGQLVMPDTHDNMQQLPDKKTEKLIKEYFAGSVIIYGYYDAQTTAAYNNQLQTWADETEHNIPLFISADLEFGAVQHVTDATVFPRLMGIGATNDVDAAKKVAEITAKEAKAVGYNWNYSPAVDVNINPLNPVIGVRAFGSTVELVTDMSLAMIAGHQENGVLATAKHFPGHGDTSIDTHVGLDVVTYDRKTLDDVHLAPFKAAIDAGVDTIMTSHIIIESIDPELPATLSEKVLTGLLRNELGYDGIIVTDAMDMGAIVDNYGRGEAAVKTILAGSDIIIAKGTFEQKIETFEGLYEAYDSGELSIERIDESVERILAKKMEYNLFENRIVDETKAKAVIDTPAHKDFAEEVAQQSITLLKNEDILPFDADADQTTLVVGPMIYDQNHYMKSIASHIETIASGKVDELIIAEDPDSEVINKAVEKAQDYDRVIVATFSASELPKGQGELVNQLSESDKPVVAFSLGLPYDLQDYPEVDAYLATYAIERWGSPVPTAWNAAVEVIFGAQPGGKLPVSIEGRYDLGTGIDYGEDPTPPKNETTSEEVADESASDGKQAEDEKTIPLYIYLIIGAIVGSVVVFIINKSKTKKD